MGALQRFVSGLVDARGSTRALALVRMFFIGLLWLRYVLGFAWFDYVGDPAKFALVVAFYLASVTAFVGFRTRLSMATVAIVLTIFRYHYQLDLGEGPDIHLGPWQVCVLLALTPCGHSLSVDRWLAVRAAEAKGDPIPSEEAPLWSVALLKAQMSSMYLFAAIDKLGHDWFSGFRLERIFVRFWGTSESLVGNTFIHGMSVVTAYATTLLEFALAIGLWIPRVRGPLILAGVGLHLSFFFFLALWPLSARMILLYLIFLDPKSVHDFIERLVKSPER